MKAKLIADKANAQIMAKIQEQVLEIFMRDHLDSFKNLGRAALKYAVDNANLRWQDYTGNLQDSLGFGIFMDDTLIYWEDLKEKEYEWALPGGRVPNHDMPPVGAQKALQSIYDGQTLGAGIQLVVVAGMDYAMNVEAINQHQVLTGSLQFTEENWSQYFRKL